jgi:prepilin-type N-terminal cleavage/methylation domain-containing protein
VLAQLYISKSPSQPRDRLFPKLKAGLTLVELLVATAIALIVSGVSFSIYRVNTSYYFREESFIQQQQNLRAALYVLGRDLRSAGNGFYILGNNVQLIQAYVPAQIFLESDVPMINAASGWFKLPDADTSENGFRARYGLDGGPNRPDIITLFKAEIEFAASIGQVGSTIGNTLNLSDELTPDTVAAGDIIALVNSDTAIIVEVQSFDELLGTIDIKTNGRFTPASGIPSSFPTEGSIVYNFRDITLVTYYIDQANNRLMAINHDHSRNTYDDLANKSVVVANNIEDMQLYYFFEHDEIDLEEVGNDPDISSERLKTEQIKAVAVAMTSRSGYEDPQFRDTRPPLYNRIAGTTFDRRRRNTLAELIYLRNFQQ